MTIDDLEVDGCRIRYCVEGTGPDTVVLVHGAGAHRFWWHLIVPKLTDAFRVVTFDLSGHGDSGRRSSYGPRVFARDIHAVASALGTGRIYLVGHSMGGRCCAAAAGEHPGDFDGLVLLDSMFPPSGPRPERPELERTLRTYPDEATARANFRLVPQQPHPPDEVLEPLISYALRRADRGSWTWKFDPESLWRYDDSYVDARLANVTCPVTYAYGAESPLPGQAIAERVRRECPDAVVARIDDGHHHLPLDSPEVCVDLIQDTVRRSFTLGGASCD